MEISWKITDLGQHKDLWQHARGLDYFRLYYSSTCPPINRFYYFVVTMGIEDLGLLLENIEEYVMEQKKVVSLSFLWFPHLYPKRHSWLCYFATLKWLKFGRWSNYFLILYFQHSFKFFFLLQVTYKWLSRTFSLNVNQAKQ